MKGVEIYRSLPNVRVTMVNWALGISVKKSRPARLIANAV
jgi:hypothetical protein